MTITPTGVKTGHVLICDFERGFVRPEMVKTRPVVVISKTKTHGRGLCTVVPLSTTPPSPVEPWHFALQHYPLPCEDQVWAKCDMIYTVSFARLRWPHVKAMGARQYSKPRLGDSDMDGVFAGVRAYLPALSSTVTETVTLSVSTTVTSESPPWVE